MVYCVNMFPPGLLMNGIKDAFTHPLTASALSKFHVKISVIIFVGRKDRKNKKKTAHSSSLYPRHLCRRVYSFHLSVRPFVCSYVRS